VVVPYELGRLRDGVGRGPEHLLAAGADVALGAHGARVRRELIELDPRFLTTGMGEEDATFELIRRVADSVRAARTAGAFPVVLSGSCFTGVGVVAGIDEASPGVVWFDTHGDFNEPSTTQYGSGLKSDGSPAAPGGLCEPLRAPESGATRWGIFVVRSSGR